MRADFCRNRPAAAWKEGDQRRLTALYEYLYCLYVYLHMCVIGGGEGGIGYLANCANRFVA